MYWSHADVMTCRDWFERAGLMIEADSGAREHTIRTGTGGALHIPPYEIRLLEIGIDDSARLQIRRQFGELDR